MDAQQAAETLQVIRTLMERTTQYQLLTARAGLIAGSLAVLGSGTFLFLNAENASVFAAVWGVVFLGSLLATVIGTLGRGRQSGEQIWSRQTKTIVAALATPLFAALVLTVFFLVQGLHLYLPGVWMLCYAQGALATANYAPPPIRTLGLLGLGCGAITLALGPSAAVPMMGLFFGLGHIGLGVALLAIERRQSALRLHRSVA